MADLGERSCFLTANVSEGHSISLKGLYDYEIRCSVSHLPTFIIESVPNTANSPHELEEQHRVLNKEKPNR